MTKSKQENNPKFGFLWGGPYFNYYTYKVTTEQTLMRHRQNQNNGNPGGSGGGGGAGPKPLMDIDFGNQFNRGGGGGGNGWGRPEPPNTSHITDQIANLQNAKSVLAEQVKQSEQNLSAQWTVLQQNNDVLAQEAIIKGIEKDLENLSRSTKVSLSMFDSVLQPIIESCTKDSISNGKSWIFQNSSSSDANRLLANYLNFKVTSTNSDFTTKLHIIYLVNDVLHHCVRKNNNELKEAFCRVAVSMYSATASIADQNQIGKLFKLVNLWETKSKFFDETILDKMKNYEQAFSDYKAELRTNYAVEINDVTSHGIETYEGYKAQHDQFKNHAEAQIEQHSAELDNLQQQLRYRGRSEKSFRVCASFLPNDTCRLI